MGDKSMIIKNEMRLDDGRMVAFMTSEISVGYKNINFSMQILDKDYVEQNSDIFKKEYEMFMQEITNEAISNGWSALSESNVTETEQK